MNLLLVFFSLSYEFFFPVDLHNSKEETRRLQRGKPSSQKGLKKFKKYQKIETGASMPTGNSSGNNQIFPLALVEGFWIF